MRTSVGAVGTAVGAVGAVGTAGGLVGKAVGIPEEGRGFHHSRRNFAFGIFFLSPFWDSINMEAFFSRDGTLSSPLMQCYVST